MEGPSLLILKEEVAFLKGRKISRAAGTANIPYDTLTGCTVRDFLSHGKHFLIALEHLTIRVHFLMFGSYRINESKDRQSRLSLWFDDDVINLYTCSVHVISDDLSKIYDWSTDVMSEEWNERKARYRLKKLPETSVADALLDQRIFAGVGNIIKNEVLYRIRLHPASNIGAVPGRKLTELIRETRRFSMEFYEWKKIYQLRKHLVVYKKNKCRRCDLPLIVDHIGKTPRLTFLCESCQVLY